MSSWRDPRLFSFIVLTLFSVCIFAQTPEPTPTATPLESTPAPEGTPEPDPSMIPVTPQDLPPPKESKTKVEDGEGGEAEAKEDEEPTQPKAAIAPQGPPGFEEYNRPLFFAPEDNKVQITSPQIRWDLTGGNRINLGGLLFESASIRVIVDQLDRDGLPSRLTEDGTGPKTTNISFMWPSFMVRTGRLAVESLQGKIIWFKDIDEGMREEWAYPFQRYTDDMRMKAHAKSPWGLIDIDLSKYPFMTNGAKFRFCITKQNAVNESIKICSSPHMTSINGNTVKVIPGTAQAKATVFIGKDEIGPNARINFPPGKKISLKVIFSNGSFVQLSSRPLEVKFLDVVSSRDGNNIVLTGRGAKPIGQVEDIEIPANHFWSATGILKEIVWKISIPKELPLLRVFGAWNVPFTYLIRYEALPREEDRVFIHKRTGSGTYTDGAWIYMYAPSGAQLSSKENSVVKTEDNFSRWNFRAKKKGDPNDSRLIIKEPGTDGRTWIAHYETYRGYSYELSGRLTGIVDSSLQPAVIGEVAASKWFERIAGIRSYGLSERRWGIAARYFRNLTPFQIIEGLDQPFSVATVDLKYNIVPGIWNRDELFGLILGFQQVEIAGLNEGMYGAGAYWARTMPKIFDDIFNWIPIFRYPKYVDVEFIYYAAAVSSKIEMNPTYNLNFHGKVFWKKTFYGEAGFGIKSFDFVDPTFIDEGGVGLDLNGVETLYGTVGLGIVF